MNNKKLRLASLLAMALVITASAQAQAVDNFDPSDYSAKLTTGLAAVGVIAGGAALLKGGVMVWNKIAKYFGRAG